ncbi:uncharacterized protein LOC128238972 [Mya arenaria]|uniref:uncharacterized protein LOC128238972 n=1 Tax=Mya arenaria TaxID=6604 RepID=UPI0022E8370F|nr:uncharacterized protein LOC128238972 [Mya arenaria]
MGFPCPDALGLSLLTDSREICCVFSNIYTKDNNDTPRGKTSRFEHIFFGLTVLSAALTILFAVLCIALGNKTNQSESTICLNCDELILSYSPFPHANKDIDALRQAENSSLCCGPLLNISKLLLTKATTSKHFEQSQKVTVGDGFYELFYDDCDKVNGIRTPKAKLAGIVDISPSLTVNGHSKLLWNIYNSTFTEHNCIHLFQEGEIFIKQPGYYIVSSLIHVRIPATTNNTLKLRPPSTNSTTLFEHHVDLLSHYYGHTRVLMQRKRSLGQTQMLAFTSMVSSVFKFQKNDRISVSISHPEYINLNHTMNHFSIYYSYDFEL